MVTRSKEKKTKVSKKDSYFRGIGSEDFIKAAEWLDEQIANGSHALLEHEISPVLAKVMLNKNTHNRKLTEQHVLFMKKEIEKYWQVNGDTIKFSRSGVLLDGQNRLTGCVDSGKAITTDIRFGLKEECFPTIDTGKGRTYSDVLSIDGENSPTELAQMVAWSLKYEKGLPSYHHYRISRQESREYLSTHPALRNSVHAYKLMKKNFNRSTPGVFGAAHYFFVQKDAKKAEDFFHMLATGLLIDSEEDPIFLLRRSLMKNAQAEKQTLEPVEIFALTIKAWNFFRKNERIKVLVWRGNESFPIIN